MRDQTELSSGKLLSALAAPRYLLMPNELEATALQILASQGESGTANNDINPWAEGAAHDTVLAAARPRVIVVDYWMDTNSWTAVADRKLYPSIGLVFGHGRTSALFSVASRSLGLMFNKDTVPIKARFFYALGAID
jgi:hypothetical protein